MILRQFPDIEWLKKQARSNFADQKGVHGIRLPEKGWPSVVMNTRSSGAERIDIAGPFSIFFNLSGKSTIKTEGKHFHLQTDTYCITNKGSHYDLVIPDNSNTTTFNIHFGEKLFEETVYFMRRHSDSSLLDQPQAEQNNHHETFPRTVWKDKEFCSRVRQLIAFYESEDSFALSRERETELLSSFLEVILQSDEKEMSPMRSIPSMKASTKTELMKRILLATEYIHDNYSTAITLDQLSDASSLSKFHLQRTFRYVKGQTPQQYLARLRLVKSLELMKENTMSLGDIARATGFSELSAFSRFFLHQTKSYPSAYREKIGKNGQIPFALDPVL